MTTAEKHLRERAESYSRDARKFRVAAAPKGRPILGADDDARMALIYGAIADALRSVADEIAREVAGNG